MMQLVGLSGSLRERSHNSRLLRAAAQMLPPAVNFQLYDGLGEIPPYNEDDDVGAPPPAVAHLRQIIADADALLIATPEYNTSIPGVLKNALDWASRPFPDNALRRKPVAVIGASLSMFGAVWAQAETRKVLVAAGAQPIDAELAVAFADEAFDEAGQLRDDAQRQQLQKVINQLLASVADPSPS